MLSFRPRLSAFLAHMFPTPSPHRLTHSPPTCTARPRPALSTPDDLRALYTITTPADPTRAAAVAVAHAGDALDVWDRARPVAAHTEAAFLAAAAWREARREAGDLRPLVLDAGCGSGRSTQWLSDAMPGADVVGIDKSGDEVGKAERRGVGACLVLRADQVDFVRLVARGGWKVRMLTMFYPSPYPKAKRFKSRVYGSSFFPMLLGVMESGGEISVRANWEGYLEDFRAAVMALRPDALCEGPEVFRVESAEEAVSKFEEKYFRCGMPVYRLNVRL